MPAIISHDRLLHLLDYNPHSGFFTWKNPTARRVKIGGRAGSMVRAGYIQIKIDGRFYYAHRLAWFYVRRGWPVKWIDHENLDKSDNRFVNLRESTISQNAANSKAHRDSNSKMKGVSKKRGKWQARIKCQGVQHRLGVYETPEAASAAYMAAASLLFGEFARGG